MRQCTGRLLCDSCKEGKNMCLCRSIACLLRADLDSDFILASFLNSAFVYSEKYPHFKDNCIITVITKNF